MNNPLIKVISVLLFVLLPSAVAAVTMVEQPDSFALGQWDEVVTQQTYYGELESWPHTFEFTVTATTTLELQVAARPDESRVSVLVVRQEERGVSEIIRQTARDTVYRKERDRLHGINLEVAPVLTVEIGPGTYRAEVSNPNNIGKYQLTVGTELASNGYWQTVQNTFAIHSFYGSWVTALLAWRVAVLWLGVLILLRVWRKRRLKSHA